MNNALSILTPALIAVLAPAKPVVQSVFLGAAASRGVGFTRRALGFSADGGNEWDYSQRPFWSS